MSNINNELKMQRSTENKTQKKLQPDEFNNQKISLANEFANNLIGDGADIIHTRDAKPEETGPIHTITIECNGQKLGKIGNKDYYPNWFLDSKKTDKGTFNDLHRLFKKTLYGVLVEKFGDHKLHIKFKTINQADKIFSVEFYHFRKISLEKPDTSWIKHSSKIV